MEYVSYDMIMMNRNDSWFRMFPRLQMLLLILDALEGFPTLKKWRSDFESLDEVKAYKAL